MKRLKQFLPLLCVVVLLNSCQSRKSFQKELQYVRADLNYELPSNLYPGKIDKTVYLNPITDSNMPVYTFVNKTKFLVLPFVLFNYWSKNYPVILGESAFTQPYYDFLIDALLATVNFELIYNENPVEIHTDDYVLDIRIINNETRSGIQASNVITLLPTSSFSINFSASQYSLSKTVSNLGIDVCLKKGGQILFTKKYNASNSFNPENNSFEIASLAKNECVFRMADCLSLTTEEIITAISIDLNIVLSAQ